LKLFGEQLNLICVTLIKPYLKIKKRFIIIVYSTHSPDLGPLERCRKSNEWNYQISELYPRQKIGKDIWSVRSESKTIYKNKVNYLEPLK